MTTPWVKSTYSADTANCVEWRQASNCAGGDCVEVGCDTSACVEVGSCDCGDDTVIQVRDSKDKTGPVLSFTPAEWTAFTAGVRAGEFDH